MRTIAPTILLLFALDLLAGCGGDKVVEPPPPARGRIAGRVWHRLYPEQPLEGVRVRWSGSSDSTNALGEYELVDLEAGADSLRLDLAGYHGESAWIEMDADSLVESFTLMPIDTIAPLPPSSFTAETEAGAHLVLRWSAPEDETRQGFALWKTPGDPHFQILSADVDSFLDVAVAPLRDYDYKLQCRDAYGNLSEALELSVEVDTYPSYSEIEVLAGADYDSIPLGWTPNTDGDFSRFRLYRGEGGSADSLDLMVYEGGDTRYTDLDVLPNDVFSYRVYSYDQTGNVATHSGSKVDAAAQIALPDYGESSKLLALPGGDDCWVVGNSSGTIRWVGAQGEDLGSLLPFTGPAFWTLIDDGTAALGVATSLSRFSRVSLDPLEETASSEPDLPPFSDAAWLGGGEVVLSMQNGGAPVVMDLGSFTITDTLQVLADTGIRAMLALDADHGLLYIADHPGSGRLRAVDLNGEPAVLQEVSLPGSPVQMRLGTEGELALAYLGPGRAERRLTAQLDSLVVSFVLDGSPDRAVLSPDLSQLWISDFETRSVSGIDMDDGEIIRRMNTVGLTLDMQVAGGGDRLFAAQTSNHVSILALDRGHD